MYDVYMWMTTAKIFPNNTKNDTFELEDLTCIVKTISNIRKFNIYINDKIHNYELN